MGRGRDVLIGGDAADAVLGGEDDDILIAGNIKLTSHEFASVHDVWKSTDDDFSSRIANLATYLQVGVTVFNDSTPVKDVLFGGGGNRFDNRPWWAPKKSDTNDWYFADTDSPFFKRDFFLKKRGDVVEKL